MTRNTKNLENVNKKICEWEKYKKIKRINE